MWDLLLANFSLFKLTIINLALYSITMGKFYKLVFGLTAFVLFFFLPLSSLAHYAGYSFEQKVGKYKIDIGYDTKPIEANAPVTFDFNVKDIKTDEYLEFGDAWVRFEIGNETYFATGVYRQELGATTLVYTFPKPGNYNMYVRFENKDQQLVEGTIPITVEPNTDEDAPNPFFQMNITLLGILIGLIPGLSLFLIVFILRKRNKNNHALKKND